MLGLVRPARAPKVLPCRDPSGCGSLVDLSSLGFGHLGQDRQDDLARISGNGAQPMHIDRHSQGQQVPDRDLDANGIASQEVYGIDTHDILPVDVVEQIAKALAFGYQHRATDAFIREDPVELTAHGRFLGLDG